MSDFIFGEARIRGDKPALIDGVSGEMISYAELAERVDGVAAGLASNGFRAGDVLAIVAPNSPSYAVAFHGAVRAGGTVTTINPLYTDREIASQLSRAKARYLVTVPDLLERVRKAVASTRVERVYVFGASDRGALSFDSLCDDGSPPNVRVDVHQSVASMPFSSGTMGLPKGVMLTHFNIVSNVTQVLSASTANEDDRLIAVLPLFHIYGQTKILNLALKVGATAVTMPRFDLEAFLKVMQDHRINRAYLVPPIILSLAKDPLVERFDLSALEVIGSGAAVLDAELTATIESRFGCVISQGYGMTETSPVTHMSPDEPGKGRAGSVGFLIPNTQAKIVSLEEKRELTVGESGEILMRGPQVMKGYLDDEEATRRTVDYEGWIHTGDIGYVDQDGYLFVVDRVKEIIKYKGYQVAPAELEAILISHPSVVDAAVVGVPDETAGELPKAFVVVNGDIDLDDIVGFVATKVSPQKKIRSIEAVDEIPRSASGKILRRLLRERSRAE